DLDELVRPVALETGEVDQLLGAADDGASFGCAGDGDAAAAAELEQALVAKQAERPEDGVRVDAEDGGEILGGRGARARLRLAFGDRASDLAGDLLVEVGRVCPVDLDTYHGTNHSSFTVSGASA